MGFGQRFQTPVGRAGLRRWVPGADAAAAAPGRLCAQVLSGRVGFGVGTALLRRGELHALVPPSLGLAAPSRCRSWAGPVASARRGVTALRSPRGRRFPGERRPRSWLRNVGVPGPGGAAGICCCLLATPGRSCARSRQPHRHVPRGAAGVVSPGRSPRRAASALRCGLAVGPPLAVAQLGLRRLWVWCLLRVPALCSPPALPAQDVVLGQ